MFSFRKKYTRMQVALLTVGAFIGTFALTAYYMLVISLIAPIKDTDALAWALGLAPVGAFFMWIFAQDATIRE